MQTRDQAPRQGAARDAAAFMGRPARVGIAVEVVPRDATSAMVED
jgi:hypothetical protein